METKKCRSCNKTLPLDNFYRNKKYHQSYCKSCVNSKKSKGAKQCLYKIVENEEIIYIGMTDDLKKRIIGHKSKLRRKGTLNGSKIMLPLNENVVNSWKWELIEEISNYYELKVKELELIATLKPKYNSPYREYNEYLATQK